MGGTLEQWLPVIINLIVAAFIYGGLYAQTRNNTKAIDANREDANKAINELRAVDGRQWDAINAHGERLAKVEAKVQ